MSLNGYLYVEGDPINLSDPNGMCAKSTTDTQASDAESIQCRQRVLSLCNTYGIELTQFEGLEFDNVWTTSRVGSVWDAVRAVSSKLLENGTAFVHTLQGFEIEIRGGDVFAPDGQTRVCAITPNGTKMSLYNCNPDDPWTRDNFIHEFGHILIHRAGGILRNWESIEQKLDSTILTQLLINAYVGFNDNSRQNDFRTDLKTYQTFTQDEITAYKSTILTEDVADMFLNWVVGGFPNDEVGRRRSEFVEGITSVFSDNTQIENIGMAEWAVRAGLVNGRPCSAQAQASFYNKWLVSIIGDKCTNIPAI